MSHILGVYVIKFSAETPPQLAPLGHVAGLGSSAKQVNRVRVDTFSLQHLDFIRRRLQSL